MKRLLIYTPVLFQTWLIAAVLLVAPSFAQGLELKPNLQPLPAFNVQLVPSTGGRHRLIFSTMSVNIGVGPLEVVAGVIDRQGRRQKVYQRIKIAGGGYTDYLAGWFAWHQKHKHFHFDGYALYTLQPIDAPGGSQRIGSKTTFCIMDTDSFDTTLPGAPDQPIYSSCGMNKQGMSVGWGDTYGYWLSGQEVDFTGNPDGTYRLFIEIDPYDRLYETNEVDNESCVQLEISNLAVRNVGECP